MAQLTSYSGIINAKQHTVAILEEITNIDIGNGCDNSNNGLVRCTINLIAM